MKTETKKCQCADCVTALKIGNWYDERMNALCDDPMTSAMGAPVSDFAEQWRREHRVMIARAIDDFDFDFECNPHCEHSIKILWSALEMYLP